MLDFATEQLKEFRQELYASFPCRKDALLSLVDALSGNREAKSLALLSLSAYFSRSYSSLYDGVEIFFHAQNPDFCAVERSDTQMQRLRKVARFLPTPKKRAFYLIGFDTTPVPRQYAGTLGDRQVVYQPNPAPGNKPIVVGHQYSFASLLPEKEGEYSPPWAIPMRVDRVPSYLSSSNVASWHIGELLSDKELPFHNTLTVGVLDSLYSTAGFLGGDVSQLENLVVITRSRGNRVFYRQLEPQEPTQKRGRGRPKSYGTPFRLKDETSWGEPDQTVEHMHTQRSGKRYTVKLTAWNNLLMRGKRGKPMHKHPFTLIQVRMFDENGKTRFQRPLWLIVFGKQRDEISLVDAWKSYKQRYDIEHFFRFGKNNLLIASYQTPDVEREENWWEIASLAYLQLWVAAPLAQWLPHPWERYSKKKTADTLLGPSDVQKDFGRIIREIETQPAHPKPRGKSPGRRQGENQTKRKRQKVVFKPDKLAA